MKVYYICEFCEQVFNETKVDGQEGSIALQGICDECASEMGLNEVSTTGVSHFYH